MNVLRLKSVLIEKGMTGKELAGKVGVSTVAISNIASGNSFPKPDLLKNIAEALDVDIRELFNPTKEETIKEAIFIKREGEYIQIGDIKLEV